MLHERLLPGPHEAKEPPVAAAASRSSQRTVSFASSGDTDRPARRKQPARLLLHLATLALACSLLLGESAQRASGIAELRAELAKIFYPPPCVEAWQFCDDPRCFVLPECRMDDVPSLRAMVAHAVTAHDRLREVALGDMRAAGPVQLHVVSVAGASGDTPLNISSKACGTSPEECKEAVGPLWTDRTPKGNAALRAWLDALSSLTLSMRLNIHEPVIAPGSTFLYSDVSKLDWQVDLTAAPGVSYLDGEARSLG